MFGNKVGHLGRVGSLTLAQRVSAMFSRGEPGAWYDPSDMSTLWQDSAGTVPVTAVEQPVGSILDKSGRGNHAIQATTTKRPIYSRRVNLLTETEFRNGVTDAPIRGGLISASALSGYSGAIAFGHDGTTQSYAYKVATGFSNTPVTLTLVVRMDDGLAPRVGLTAGPSNDFRIIINGLFVLPVQEEIAPGVYRLTASLTITSGGTPNFGVIKYSNDSAKTFKVTAYSLTLATDASLPYQRVNTASDYDADPAKFPAYLSFDGVDDALQTGNIDFTGTDKMTVWAGVTKLSDAVRNPIIEVGGYGVAQGFGLYSSPQGTANQMQAFHAAANAVHVYAAGTPPNANYVLGLQSDLSAPKIAMRRSGVAAAESTASPGVGTYGNLPASIGAGTGGFCFKGRLYSLIVRGAQSSLSQIEATELYTKQKMRLP